MKNIQYNKPMISKNVKIISLWHRLDNRWSEWPTFWPCFELPARWLGSSSRGSQGTRWGSEGGPVLPGPRTHPALHAVLAGTLIILISQVIFTLFNNYCCFENDIFCTRNWCPVVTQHIVSLVYLFVYLFLLVTHSRHCILLSFMFTLRNKRMSWKPCVASPWSLQPKKNRRWLPPVEKSLILSNLKLWCSRLLFVKFTFSYF